MFTSCCYLLPIFYLLPIEFRLSETSIRRNAEQGNALRALRLA